MTSIFDDYENCLYNIAQSIYKSYVQRFIKHNQVVVPREEFQVIRECHSWHLSDRNTNRISLEKIITVLNKQPPTNLNHMIRRFKMELEEKTKNPRSVESSPAIVGSSSPEHAPKILRTSSKMKNMTLV